MLKQSKNRLLITLFISSWNEEYTSNKFFRKHNPEEITSKQEFYITLNASISFLLRFKLIEVNNKNLKKFLYLSNQEIN